MNLEKKRTSKSGLGGPKPHSGPYQQQLVQPINLFHLHNVFIEQAVLYKWPQAQSTTMLYLRLRS